MEKEKIVNSIVKALAYTENGGKPDIHNPSAGKTGEAKSIFQFTPATWKQYSKDTFGKEMPLTADNETYVVQKKVGDWVDKGLTARQIASMWNAGPGEPDAYTGKFSDGSSSSGVNKKYGVKYDVPGYADKVLAYSKQFYQGGNNQNNTQNDPNLNSIMSTIKTASSPVSSPGQGLMSKAVSGVSSPL